MTSTSLGFTSTLSHNQLVHTRLAEATVKFGNQEVNQLKIANLSDQGMHFQGGPRFVSRMDGGPFCPRAGALFQFQLISLTELAHQGKNCS